MTATRPGTGGRAAREAAGAMDSADRAPAPRRIAGVKVRLFAALRELAGTSLLEVSSHDVRGLLEELSGRFGPAFARISAAGTVVVNGETADREQELAPGDEVALLPPVSGGGSGAEASETAPVAGWGSKAKEGERWT